MCLKGSVVTHNVQEDFSFKYSWKWMVNSLVVRARGLEYGGREFESRSLHLKPETKLKKERKNCWTSGFQFRHCLGFS